MKMKLLRMLGDIVTPERSDLRIMELCSGVGVIGLSLAHATEGSKELKQVTLLSTDVNPNCESLFAENAKRIFPKESICEVKFSTSSAAEALAALGPNAADVLVIDPPRRGLADRSFRRGLVGGEDQTAAICNSGVKAVIYMSCGYNSFMADAERLMSGTSAGAFELKSLSCYDMFPYTPHLECLGIFQRLEHPNSLGTPSVGTSKTQADPGQKLQCQFIIGIEQDRVFNVKQRLLGERGHHMKLIAQRTDCKLRLRGRGSNFKEGPARRESTDPLMLCISSKNQKKHQEAVMLVQGLVEDVYKQYRSFLQASGKDAPELQVRIHEGPRPGSRRPVAVEVKPSEKGTGGTGLRGVLEKQVKEHGQSIWKGAQSATDEIRSARAFSAKQTSEVRKVPSPQQEPAQAFHAQEKLEPDEAGDNEKDTWSWWKGRWWDWDSQEKRYIEVEQRDKADSDMELDLVSGKEDDPIGQWANLLRKGEDEKTEKLKELASSETSCREVDDEDNGQVRKAARPSISRQTSDDMESIMEEEEDEHEELIKRTREVLQHHRGEAPDLLDRKVSLSAPFLRLTVFETTDEKTNEPILLFGMWCSRTHGAHCHFEDLAGSRFGGATESALGALFPYIGCHSNRCWLSSRRIRQMERTDKPKTKKHSTVWFSGRFREVRFLKMLKSMMPEDFKRKQILIHDYAATLHCFAGKKPVSVLHGVTAGKAAER
eukprot:symbB.v1.2.027363.t1/scaffold2803.1/size69972/5